MPRKITKKTPAAPSPLFMRHTDEALHTKTEEQAGVSLRPGLFQQLSDTGQLCGRPGRDHPERRLCPDCGVRSPYRPVHHLRRRATGQRIPGGSGQAASSHLSWAFRVRPDECPDPLLSQSPLDDPGLEYKRLCPGPDLAAPVADSLPVPHRRGVQAGNGEGLLGGLPGHHLRIPDSAPLHRPERLEIRLLRFGSGRPVSHRVVVPGLPAAGGRPETCRPGELCRNPGRPGAARFHLRGHAACDPSIHCASGYAEGWHCHLDAHLPFRDLPDRQREGHPDQRAAPGFQHGGPPVGAVPQLPSDPQRDAVQRRPVFPVLRRPVAAEYGGQRAGGCRAVPCGGGGQHSRGQPAADLCAAAILPALWPHLPDLRGAEFLLLSGQYLVHIRHRSGDRGVGLERHAVLLVRHRPHRRSAVPCLRPPLGGVQALTQYLSLLAPPF